MESALAAWKGIDLHNLQISLDKQAEEIIANEKASLLERKELATSTKDFKKVPDDEKLEVFKSLLKSYQSGIDALTKRAKIAENSFLAVYRTLAEAPDPYPLLEVAVDSILTVERVKELQAENSALRTKLAKQADYDSISQKLRNADSKLEMTIQQKVKTRESELLAVVDEKEKNWMDREASLQQQLQEAREATKDLRVSKIIEEKLNTHNDPERNIAGQLAETDIVLRDLERVNMRMIQVEQRNSDLRSEIAGLQTGAGTSAQIDADNLGRKLANLEADYDALARKFESDKSIHKEREGLTSDTLKKLEKGCRLQEQEIEAMKQKIRDKADYDELKRELNILKQIEFSIDDEQDSSSRENVKQHSAVATTLESLLVGRNQKLSDELTHMRVSNNELLETVTDLKTDLDLLNQELAEQKALSAKLENDLMRVNENSHPGYAASVAPSRYTSKTGTGTKRPISPTTSIIGYREDPFASLSKANELETGILPIITQQRDRFRNKVAELEGELGKQANTVLHLKNEIQSLQRDNTQMYERIRYLSQYSSKTSETDIAVSIGTSGASSKQAGDGTFGRYRSAYEISKNPFEAFRSKESAKALRGLNTVDRTILSFMRSVLLRKVTRNIFASYTLLLHVLLFVLLYNRLSAEEMRVRPAMGAFKPVVPPRRKGDPLIIRQLTDR